MAYDFDRVIERRGTNSAKWDLVGSEAIPMWVADMDFQAPPQVVAALTDRVSHGVLGYALPSESLRESFCNWQERRNGWRPDPAHTVVSPGVVPSIKAAIEACTDPGAGVVVQPPVYFPFFSSVEDAGRELMPNPLRPEPSGYRMDLDHLETLFKEGAQMIVLCSPHNPVGRVWTEAELRELGELCVRYRVLIVSDEIHGDIVYSGHRFVPTGALSDEIAEITICCNSPSKTFNIAGNAVGFCVAQNAELRGKLKHTLRRFGLDHPSVLEMVASEAAYNHGEPWLEELLPYLEGNVARIEAFCREHSDLVSPVPIEGTYIQWLDFTGLLEKTHLDDSDLKKLLEEEAQVVLSHGPQFGAGGERRQRLNFATPRSILDEGLSRISRAIRRAVGRSMDGKGR